MMHISHMEANIASKSKKKWYTAYLDYPDMDKEHASYDAAKFYAQCTHDTDKSPKRQASGDYILGRTHILREDVYMEFRGK